jgi:hypothetical protein
MYVSIVKDNISVVIHFKVIKLKRVFIQRNRTTVVSAMGQRTWTVGGIDMSALASTHSETTVYRRTKLVYVYTII